MYRFNPATPTIAAVDLGTLSVTQPAPGFSSISNFAGGDIAFDGLGNMTGAFTDASILAIFPAQYAADGTYNGFALQGQRFSSITSNPASVALLSNGNYIIGGLNGSSIVNTNTGTETDLSGNFPTSDMASCAAPAPNLVVQKTATSTCSGTTAGVNIQYTITVQNTGQFHAINTRLIDALPADVTLQSATLNGQPIANVSTLATTGIPIRSTTATTDGQVFKNETATIVLNCTAPQTVATYSNQAFVKYNGVESRNLPNDQIPSDNPATPTANDATPVTTTACFSISGTVFNDANGLNDGNINGTGTNAGGLFAVLLDGNGNVVSSVSVAPNGTYSFPSYPSGNYSVRISTTSGGAVSLPAGWVSTGEDCCDNSGSDGAVDGTTPVTVGTTSITDVNFGIEQRPVVLANTDTSRPNPGGNTTSPVSATVFQGNDAEDGSYSNNLTNRSVTLTPATGGTLFYGGTPITASTVIPNFDPANLTIDPAATGATSVSFTYSVQDNAGVASLPVTITIPFTAPLPVSLVSFTAQAQLNQTVLLNWTTAWEKSNHKFIIERSKDLIQFETVGEVSDVAGSSNASNSYRFVDTHPFQGTSYYRLTQLDRDGSRHTFPAEAVILEGQYRVSPNPVTGGTFVLELDEPTRAVINLYDMQGRNVSLRRLPASGTSVTLQALNKLAPGVYVLKVAERGTVREYRLVMP